MQSVCVPASKSLFLEIFLGTSQQLPLDIKNVFFLSSSKEVLCKNYLIWFSHEKQTKKKEDTLNLLNVYDTLKIKQTKPKQRNKPSSERQK